MFGTSRTCLAGVSENLRGLITLSSPVRQAGQNLVHRHGDKVCGNRARTTNGWCPGAVCPRSTELNYAQSNTQMQNNNTAGHVHTLEQTQHEQASNASALAGGAGVVPPQ